MKTIAIMQPYLFPYIGYFQLIHSVDSFVICDDVQYIREGWVNRNRILLDGRPYYITLPVERGHRSDNINQRNFSLSKFKEGQEKILHQLSHAYRKAMYFSEVMRLVEQVFACEERDVASFLACHLKKVCDYLGIETPFLISSETKTDTDGLTGQDRIIAMCRAMNANHYINPIGGQTLYDRETFERQGIKLSFIKTGTYHYTQFANKFVSDLSIIDVMMFNSVDKIHEMLNKYQLSYLE